MRPLSCKTCNTDLHRDDAGGRTNTIPKLHASIISTCLRACISAPVFLWNNRLPHRHLEHSAKRNESRRQEASDLLKEAGGFGGAWLDPQVQMLPPTLPHVQGALVHGDAEQCGATEETANDYEYSRCAYATLLRARALLPVRALVGVTTVGTILRAAVPRRCLGLGAGLLGRDAPQGRAQVEEGAFREVGQRPKAHDEEERPEDRLQDGSHIPQDARHNEHSEEPHP